MEVALSQHGGAEGGGGARQPPSTLPGAPTRQEFECPQAALLAGHFGHRVDGHYMAVSPASCVLGCTCFTRPDAGLASCNPAEALLNFVLDRSLQ